MKNYKILFLVFLMIFFLSACKNEKEIPQSLENNNQSDSNLNEEKELAINFEDRTGRVIKHAECNEENPPKVIDTDFGKTLDFCGKQNIFSFSAYDLEDKDKIFFGQSEYMGDRDFTILGSYFSTIDKKEPFEEKVLLSIKDFNQNDLRISETIYEYNHPSNGDFYFWQNLAAKKILLIYSDKNEKAILINNNKIHMDDFERENNFTQENNCEIMMLERAVNYEERAKIYAENFGKIPCIDQEENLVGFFDIENNSFETL